jgi:acyl-CoA oxidase
MREPSERVILEQFVNTVEKAEPKSLKPALKRMCDLFALSQIERYQGRYFEQGAMTGLKSRAISRQVDKLCAEVRQEAAQLVDAFGIPDSCVAAPIAL